MKVGQKISFDGMEGYIVGITIDPLEESEVRYESYTYTIRVFKPFYKDGYFDFQRSGHDLMKSWQKARKGNNHEEVFQYYHALSI